MNWYVYDTQSTLPIVIQDKDNKYVIGLGLLYAVDDDDDAFFYHYDGSGSVVIVTEEDEDPRSRSRYQYNAYGETQDVDDFFEQPFMYAGQQNDSYDTSGMPNTGLYYMRARYYDPIVGRFMSRDPYKGDVRSPQTLNPHLYAMGNPANFKDPSGLLVFGPCVNADAGLIYYQALSICLVLDTQTSLALAVSHDEGGVAGASLGGGFSILGSSVNTIQELEGANYSFGGSAGEGLKLAGDVELILDENGNWVPTSVSLALDLGASATLPAIPGELHFTVSNTAVRELINFADVGRRISNWLFPGHDNVWVGPKR